MQSVELRQRPTLKQWILTHDERWSFILCYLGLAVILSVCISLFWLVVVVGLHGTLEWICQRSEDACAQSGVILSRVAWALKLDISLILFALALGVYMEIIMGMAGIGAATRAGVQGAKGGARFLVWEKALRAMLLSLDDLAQVLRVLLRKTASPKTEGEAECAESLSQPDAPFVSAETGRSWRDAWSTGDWFCMIFGAACLLMIGISPWVTGHGLSGVLRLIGAELHPWP
ncbi:hypothetical protein OOT00_04860 [Desulfobotulus sp. H1]|uniref:Uncharacterized protein n=1 Tax=Desulfobotulus pelophilus TaxID=2823377 RepID=A0ABT3N782_9BACT|nr:hypothetical protein [Desulfobotulus pelophilus]MCW7753315.1 hypothetical protein [Desulfobotulus pelophilus]